MGDNYCNYEKRIRPFLHLNIRKRRKTLKITEKTAKTAKELVEKMTIEEKCSQLRYDSPAVEHLGIPAYNWWNEGLHGLARAGTATMFPQAIGLAATFDDELIRKIGRAIALETRAKYNACSVKGDRDIYKGLTLWSPNVNIFRDPRWGRGHETYGEDPFLAGHLGAAFVRGIQGEDDEMTASACAKHFAVHSGPEALRHEFDAEVSQKDLHETYLPAFEELVKAGVSGFMGAYNRVNGEPACANTQLMKILREEWGFNGYFVSDCWAIRDFHTHHHVTASITESAALALKKGCDVNCGCSYLHILEAYNEGLVSEADIERAITKLLEIRIALGSLGESENDKIPYTVIDCPEHNRLSLEAAQRSMVLLRNDGILPLNKAKISTIGVIGCSADSREALKGNYYGTASGYTTFLEGIKRECGDDIRVLYSQGCDFHADRCECLAQPDDRLSEAAVTAELSDVVILCVGLNEHLEGEEGDDGNEYASGDKESLLLPLSQRKLIKTVLDAGKPTIIVIAAGSSVTLGDERGNALLCAWYPGPHGGTALADILFGKISPSGKLPVTFYKDTALLPDFTDYSMKNRTYRYLESSENVWFPFGFGLTYSDFACRIISTEKCGENILVKFSAQNIGSADSENVVQLYLGCSDENAPLNPWLCAAKRISLKAGESAELVVEIKKDRFRIFGESSVYFAREYRIFCGFGQPKSDAEFVKIEM